MRFSLRDLFWATALVAVGLSWWLDNQAKDAAIGQSQRLHSSLDVAKKWHDLEQSGYFTRTGINVLPVPSTPTDWAPLDEPLIKP